MRRTRSTPWSRPALLVLTLAVVASLAGASHAAWAGSSSTVPLYVSTTGSDSAPCTQSAPCRTFDRAYHVAVPGQTVIAAAGSYPSQTITSDSSKVAPAVIFVPSSVGAVSLSNLTIMGSYVDVRNLIITGVWYVGTSSTVPQSAQPHHVALRKVSAARFFINGASNVSVLGGSVGPTVDQSAQIRSCYLCGYDPQNILIDGVTFHDFTRATSGVHMECLHVYPAQGLTIRNSRFLNCAVFDLFLANFGDGGDLRDITLENNVFDRPGSHADSLSAGYYAVMFNSYGRTITNVRIAYNSLLVGAIPGLDSGTSNAVVEANVGPSVSCLTGVVYRYNVWTNKKCGSTDRVASTGFVDPASYNFTTAAGAASVNAGNVGAYPTTDATGRTRYLGSAPDSGAYEVG
jgi:hypothetical protein